MPEHNINSWLSPGSAISTANDIDQSEPSTVTSDSGDTESEAIDWLPRWIPGFTQGHCVLNNSNFKRRY